MKHFFEICYDVKIVLFELTLMFSFVLFLWSAARHEWKRQASRKSRRRSE
jgi:hypothetical protein